MHTPESIKWEVAAGARQCLDKIRDQMSGVDYAADKRSLQAFLCNYFNTGDCQHKLGASISPMKSSQRAAGGKCLKVRWGVPGGGKSGGLRLAIVAYCAEKRVTIAGAWNRIADPSDAEFEEATQG